MYYIYVYVYRAFRETVCDSSLQYDFFFLNKFILFILLLVVLGLHCCTRAFSSVEWGLLFVVVRGLLIAVVSLVVEHGL